MKEYIVEADLGLSHYEDKKVWVWVVPTHGENQVFQSRKEANVFKRSLEKDSPLEFRVRQVNSPTS